MKPKSLKLLNTAADVVEAFGERIVLMQVTKVTSTQAITNWLVRGYFPSHLYLVMNDWLEQHGFTAAPELWRQLTAEAALPQDAPQVAPAASP